MHLVRQAAGGGEFHGRLGRGVPRVGAGPGPRRLVHQVGGGGAGGGRSGETVSAIPLQWNKLIKGTVRPDRICMRVIPRYHWVGLEKDINRYRFLFFILSFEYLKKLQSFVPLHTKMNPTSCLIGSVKMS